MREASAAEARIGLVCRREMRDLIIATSEAGELALCESHLRVAAADPWTMDFLDTLACCGVATAMHETRLNFMAKDEPDLAAIREAWDRLSVVPTLLSGHLASGLEMTALGEAFSRPAYCLENLHRVADRIRRVEDYVGCHVGAENIALYGPLPGDEIEEVEFLNRLDEIVPRSIVFDVSNFVANVRNHRRMQNTLSALEVEPAYFHVSGGIWRGDQYFDTHAHCIDDDMLLNLEGLARDSARPVVYERDMRLNETAELRADLGRLRSAVSRQEIEVL